MFRSFNTSGLASNHPDNRGLRVLYEMAPFFPGSNLRIVDQSRNRRDAAISAVPVWDVAPGGRLGLKFDGSTQSGTAPNSSGDSGLTVAFWWKTTSTTSNYVAIGWFDRMWVGLENGKLAFFPNYTGSIREPAATANDGKWHRCVATHLNGTSKVFIDGIERASGAGTLHTTPITTMGVAQFGSSTGYRFPGSLAGIRVHGVGFQSDWAVRDYKYSQNLLSDPRLNTFSRIKYFLPESTTFTGTAALSIKRQTLAGTGTFTKPTYTGTGALSVKGQTLAGTGTFAKPTYTGSGTLSAKGQTLAGTGTFTKPTYTGVGWFMSMAAQTLSGTGTFTQPSYVGTGVLVTKETSLSGVGSFTADTYTGVGSLQTPTTLLSGSGSVTQSSYTGEGVLSIRASYLEASSTFTPPTYSGIAGFISAAMLAAGSGTFTQPTYTGLGNLTSTPQNLTASGTFTKPTYTGTGVLLVQPTITSGTGNVEQPTYTGTADLLSSKTEIDGMAAFALPVFTGEANFNTASVILSGEGAYTFPVYSGTSAFTVKGVEFVGAAGLVSPIYSGSAVLQSSPATLSGVGAYTAPITVVVITTEAWNVYGVDFDSWINNVDISQISWNIPEFNIGNWKTVNVDLLHWQMKLVSTGKWHIPGE